MTDLYEDMAAEQKARSTYDNILRMVKDPDVADPIRFLRAREIVHFQRFGEALRILQDELDSKNFYAYNPSLINPSVVLLLQMDVWKTINIEKTERGCRCHGSPTILDCSITGIFHLKVHKYLNNIRKCSGLKLCFLKNAV